eukprot:m.124617 g.124617  ORF g.124617 m.124617 type:complete len:701 (-) comp16298_c1_seq3:1621-3723(-)
MSVLVIGLVHGNHGAARDWQAVEASVREEFARSKQAVYIGRSRANERLRTHDGIDVCGERLAEEVKQWVQAAREEHPGKEVHLMLVCHSLGGLIGRYACGVLQAEHLFLDLEEQPLAAAGSHVDQKDQKDQKDSSDTTPATTPKSCGDVRLHSFVSLSSPHLGSRRPAGGSWWDRTRRVAQHALLRTFYGRTGMQLLLEDGDKESPPLLLAMSEPDHPSMQAIKACRHRTLVSFVEHDFLVPHTSAALKINTRVANRKTSAASALQAVEEGEGQGQQGERRRKRTATTATTSTSVAAEAIAGTLAAMAAATAPSAQSAAQRAASVPTSSHATAVSQESQNGDKDAQEEDEDGATAAGSRQPSTSTLPKVRFTLPPGLEAANASHNNARKNSASSTTTDNPPRTAGAAAADAISETPQSASSPGTAASDNSATAAGNTSLFASWWPWSNASASTASSTTTAPTAPTATASATQNKQGSRRTSSTSATAATAKESAGDGPRHWAVAGAENFSLSQLGYISALFSPDALARSRMEAEDKDNRQPQRHTLPSSTHSDSSLVVKEHDRPEPDQETQPQSHPQSQPQPQPQSESEAVVELSSRITRGDEEAATLLADVSNEVEYDRRMLQNLRSVSWRRLDLDITCRMPFLFAHDFVMGKRPWMNSASKSCVDFLARLWANEAPSAAAAVTVTAGTTTASTTAAAD